MCGGSGLQASLTPRSQHANPIKICSYSVVNAFLTKRLRRVCLYEQSFRIAPKTGPGSPRCLLTLPLTLQGAVVIFRS